jgi:hypothetical protein
MHRHLVKVAMLIAGFWTAAAVLAAASELELREVHIPATAWISRQDHALRNSLKSFETDDEFREGFGKMVRALVTRDWAKAARIGKSLRYEVVSIKSGGSQLIVASDASRAGLQPIIVVNIDPKRDLIAEAPHVPFERGTAEEAIAIVERLGARVALISGADRCASRTHTTCDGRSRVCGGLQAYRESDVGHNPDSLFHFAHVIFAEAWPSAVVISLHRMGEDKDGVRTSIVMSDGTTDTSGPASSAAARFRMELGRELPEPGRVVSCNRAEDRIHKYRILCGTTNVQGRQINGDDDVCDGGVETGGGRFIHLEQDRTILAPYEDSWNQLDEHSAANAMIKALGKAIARMPPP